MPISTPYADKYKLTGSNPIRSFLWDRLQSQLGWSKAESGGLIPITIPQDQPDFQNYSAPYVVYKWTMMNSGESFLLKEEQIAFTVLSQEEDQIRTCINMMYDQFSRYDDSASDINSWILAHGSEKEKKFDFKYTYVISASGPQPATSEGGRMDGMIIVRVCYSVDSDSHGMRN